MIFNMRKGPKGIYASIHVITKSYAVNFYMMSSPLLRRLSSEDTAGLDRPLLLVDDGISKIVDGPIDPL